MTLPDYAQWAKQQKKKNPKMNSKDMEDAWLRMKRSSEKQGSPLTAPKPKPASKQASSRPAAQLVKLPVPVPVSDKHAKAVALAVSHLRPTPQTPLVAHCPQKMHVITQTTSGYSTVVVPSGSRLFWSPVAGSSNLGLGFFVPRGNAEFGRANNYNADNRRYLDELMTVYPSGTSDFDDNVPIGNLIRTVARQGSFSSLLNPTSPDLPAGNQSLRETMASYSFDLQVGTTYLASALVNCVTTDSDNHNKQIMPVNHSGFDEEGTRQIYLRNSLSNLPGNLGESINDLVASRAPDLVGPGKQHHFVGNVRLCRPQWWNSGRQAAEGTVNYDEINACRLPFDNPYFGAYHTGSWITVDAVGGDVTVVLKVKRSMHHEFSIPHQEESSVSAISFANLMRGHVHSTTSDSVVSNVLSAPTAMVASSPTQSGALAILDRNTGVPPGTHQPIVPTDTTLHPAPIATAAKEIWGEVKGVGSVIGEGVKDVASVVKTVYNMKAAWSAAKDIGEFASMLL